MILNVGCGGRPHDKQSNYGDVRIDIMDFPNVTDVMDVHDLPREWENRFTEVVCDTSLEHFDQPLLAMMNMAMVLKKGGVMRIVVPNVYYWRRIYRNWKQGLKHLNEADPEKMPNHKAAWDLIEFNNLIKQVEGLRLTAVTYVDWQPEWRKRDVSLIGGILDRLLPPMLNRIEVIYMLKKV